MPPARGRVTLGAHAMEDREIEVLLDQAHAQRRLGDWKRAIELVQRALALDPDHGKGHAALAVSLLGARRLAAALVEVRLALGLDGNDPYVHYAAAMVYRAARKLDDAWAHCLIAIGDAEGDAASHVLGAQIQALRGDRDKARELCAEALALDAAHPGALAQLARLELADGHLTTAAERAREALQASPGDLDAHVVAGLIALRRGDLVAAETHARFVLTQDGNDEGGLGLFVAIKVRRSPALGLWWRLNSWLTSGEDPRRVALMSAIFVLAGVLIIVTDEMGYPNLSRVLWLTWLGTSISAWIGPLVFRHWLKRELHGVKPDPTF